tara:strand:+ start:32 stop:1432 length:1401 start_codon:yes stop_codon:yes gene_type:complete
MLNNIEHYCKVPKKNNQGSDNYFDADIDFKSQSNISNSNCDKYWKKFPNESNSIINLNEPVPIPGNQIKLPVEAGVGNSLYKFGLINFNKLASLINDNKSNKNIVNNSKKLIIHPINKSKLNFEYEVNFIINDLNKKTDIKRFNEYNPTKINNFKYISSPIKEINILNKEFLNRINEKQINIMKKKDLILNGKLNYQIYSYRIIDIQYINSNINNPLFIMQINLFQEYNYFINSFSYIGYIKQNNININNVEFIGVNINSNFLTAPGYDKNSPKNYFILNKNFNDFQPRIKDVNEALKIIDNKKKLDSLESNYACFNTDINSPNSILNYDTKTLCESNIDHYGRPKPVGIYDKPCKKDEECPFYKSNKNYNNNYGGCINGKCELPVNMKNVGYHYYSYNNEYNPLCYNCDKDNFDIISTRLDDCCEKQMNSTEYKKLKSPDYAFKNDIINRINYYNQKNYKSKQLI